MIIEFLLRPSCIGITGLYYREPLFTYRAPKSRCLGGVTSGNRGKGQENQNRRGQEDISEAVQSGRFGARRRRVGGGAGVSRDRACRERRRAIISQAPWVALSGPAGPVGRAALGLHNLSLLGCQPLIRLVAVQGVAHSCWRCRNLCRAFWVRMRVFR